MRLSSCIFYRDFRNAIFAKSCHFAGVTAADYSSIHSWRQLEEEIRIPYSSRRCTVSARKVGQLNGAGAAGLMLTRRNDISNEYVVRSFNYRTLGKETSSELPSLS